MMTIIEARRHEVDQEEDDTAESAEGAERREAMPNDRLLRQQPTEGTTLLERLLALLRQGGVLSISEVAEELGTSPELVETMLDDLARRGYVRPVEAQCGLKCAGCPYACGGGVAGAGRLWRVEEEGGGSVV